MPVNWTQEPARSEQPQNPQNALAWTLWGLSAAVILTWVVCMALGITWGGRVHLLLALFGLLMVGHVIMGFRNVKYFVPLRLDTHHIGWLGSGWLGRWSRHREENPGEPSVGESASAPLTSFDKGTTTDETNRAQSTTADILPGNDPVSGPGQRKPDPMP